MVVCVGARWVGVEFFGFCYLSDKEHVATEVYFFFNFTGEESVCILGEIVDAVMASFFSGEVGKFIHFPACCHSKLSYCFKWDIFC